MNSHFGCPIVTAEEFGNIYPTVLKFTNASATHRGVSFRVGEISIDPIPFSLGACAPGGIYFTDEANAREWCNSYSQEIGQITRVFLARVPAGAQVMVFRSKAKSTQLEIIRELDYHETLKKIKANAEEERKRMEEERKRMEEERKRREEERKRIRQIALDKFGIQFHRFLEPDTVDEMKEKLCSEKLYPILEKLMKQGGHPNIDDPSFDSLYEALYTCIMESDVKRLFLAPFFCPRLVHVALLRNPSKMCDTEIIEAFELYPEFFSKQRYSPDLKKSLSYLQGTEKALNLRKALGMI